MANRWICEAVQFLQDSWKFREVQVNKLSATSKFDCLVIIECPKYSITGWWSNFIYGHWNHTQKDRNSESLSRLNFSLVFLHLLQSLMKFTFLCLFFFLSRKLLRRLTSLGQWFHHVLMSTKGILLVPVIVETKMKMMMNKDCQCRKQGSD